MSLQASDKCRRGTWLAEDLVGEEPRPVEAALPCASGKDHAGRVGPHGSNAREERDAIHAGHSQVRDNGIEGFTLLSTRPPLPSRPCSEKSRPMDELHRADLCLFHENEKPCLHRSGPSGAVGQARR